MCSRTLGFEFVVTAKRGFNESQALRNSCDLGSIWTKTLPSASQPPPWKQESAAGADRYELITVPLTAVCARFRVSLGEGSSLVPNPKP